MSDQMALTKVKEYFGNDIIRANFREILGSRDSGAYISSVLLAVSDSRKLQECSLESIYKSALRAATLRLSVDPGTGQAYLVPYKGKATLIVGYKGLQDMAVRTGKYRYINVGPIYEGETIEEDRISGFLKITGHKIANKVIGWIAAFEMYMGFAKTIYMTCEEIHAHANKYAPSYHFSDSMWKTNPEKMERKTVLRTLLRQWGYLDPSDSAVLKEIESETEVIEGVVVDDTGEIVGDSATVTKIMTLDEAKSIRTAKGTELGTLGKDQLQLLIDKYPSGAPLHIAAQIILDAWDQPAEKTNI